MATRVPRASWQDQYAFWAQTANLFDPDNISSPTTGDFGPAEDVFGWDVLGHPNASNKQTFIDNRKAYGIPTRYTGSGAREFQQGVFEAGGSFEYQVSCGALIAWLWTMFQDGTSHADVSGSGSLEQYRFQRYTSSDIEVVNNIVRNMAASGSYSHRLGGSIAQSIQLAVGENDVLKATMEAISYAWSNQVDWGSLDSNVSSYSSQPVLLFQDANVYLGGEQVVIPTVEMTITNSAVMKFYNSQNAQRFVLGDLAITGTISVPWEAHPETASPGTDQGLNQQLTDFQNGVDKPLIISWGNSDEDNSLRIQLNIRYQTPEIESSDNDEIRWSLPFIAAYDGTNEAVRIYATEAADPRGVGATHSYANYDTTTSTLV